MGDYSTNFNENSVGKTVIAALVMLSTTIECWEEGKLTQNCCFYLHLE